MEHRLIQGGEQYLPFARSCVAKLKRLGLPYAGQSFEIDGVSIKVRVEPGHEYIRIDGAPAAMYMETGQLEWSFPGELNPARYDPADWHFLDISTKADYLGLIYTKQTNAEHHVGSQKNDPALSEGMDSLAVGYPQKYVGVDSTAETIAAVAAKNAETKEAYGEVTVVQKITKGLFQPTVFSGKMRLFMQAQYGRPEDLEYNPFIVDMLGTEYILMYQCHPKLKGDALQFGFWSHHDQGIYTAEDGTYWLIKIRNPTGGTIELTHYPIVLAKVVLPLWERLNDPTTPKDEKAKLEAYVLSQAHIDTSKPTLFHSFEDSSGSAIAYGWKWNTVGDKVSIVANKTLGTDNADNRWNSTTIHISIGSSLVGKVRTFSATVEKTSHGDWQDGWGTYNIFVPSDDMGYLVHYSVKSFRAGAKADFDFKDVAVYGFYKDDVWQPVVMGRTVEDGVTKYIQKNDMAFPDPTVADTVTNRYQHDARYAKDGYVYESSSYSKSTSMGLSLGGFSVGAKSYYGTHAKVVETTSNFGPIGGVTANFVSQQFSGLYFVAADIYGNVPGWDNLLAYAAGRGYPVAADYTAARCTYTTDEWYWTGWKNQAWTLVIPSHDCEAVFIGVHDNDTVESLSHTKTVQDNQTYALALFGQVCYPRAGYTYGWYGDGPTNITRVTDTTPPPKSVASITCFSQAVWAKPGAFHASSEPLFYVDWQWPYYMANMSAYTSYNKRYIISEGLSSHGSIKELPFVGWA